MADHLRPRLRHPAKLMDTKRPPKEGAVVHATAFSAHVVTSSTLNA